MCAKALSCPTNIPPLILTICLEVLHLVEELLVIDVHSERTELLESLAMILHLNIQITLSGLRAI